MELSCKVHRAELAGLTIRNQPGKLLISPNPVINQVRIETGSSLDGGILSVSDASGRVIINRTMAGEYSTFSPIYDTIILKHKRQLFYEPVPKA